MTNSIARGLYEFGDFNAMIEGLAPAVRADLHRNELFDDAAALTNWLADGNGLVGLGEHLNDHIRTDPICYSVESAARLGFKATRDGSPLKFFLRVGGPRGAAVGIVEGGDPFVAVVIQVPQDWPHLGTGAKVAPTPALQQLLESYESYQRDAHIMVASEVMLPDPAPQTTD